jgi:hypothetical protein
MAKKKRKSLKRKRKNPKGRSRKRRHGRLARKRKRLPRDAFLIEKAGLLVPPRGRFDIYKDMAGNLYEVKPGTKTVARTIPKPKSRKYKKRLEKLKKKKKKKKKKVPVKRCAAKTKKGKRCKRYVRHKRTCGSHRRAG